MGKQIFNNYRILGNGIEVEGTNVEEWQYTEIDISSAEILAMGTTPIEILPAPGAGKYYNVDTYILEYNLNSLQYSFPADYVAIRNLGGDAIATINNLIEASTDKSVVIRGGNANINTTDLNTLYVAESLNSAIILDSWQGTNPTLGDGTLKVKIKYKVETFG